MKTETGKTRERDQRLLSRPGGHPLLRCSGGEGWGKEVLIKRTRENSVFGRAGTPVRAFRLRFQVGAHGVPRPTLCL
jgi:hypothetical protein